MEWFEAIAIVPLDPVVEGHVIVIPRMHVTDFADSPETSAMVMLYTAQLAADMGSCNLITSKGKPATQSVFHLHMHLIPRAADDGIALPWYSGRRKISR